MTKKICRICLRTDKNLKTTSKVLTEYHDEICNFNIDTAEPLFCSVCEHQLKKHYNFRNKCLRAAKIFQKWEAHYKNAPETHPDSLHNLLPESCQLSLSNPDTVKVIKCSHENNEEPKPTLFILEGLIIHDKEKETNHQNSTDNTIEKAINAKPTKNTTRRNPPRKKSKEKEKTEEFTKKDNIEKKSNIELLETEELKNDDDDDDDKDYIPELDDVNPEYDSDENDNKYEDDSTILEPKNESPIFLEHNYNVKKENVLVKCRKRSLNDFEDENIESDDSSQGNVKRKRKHVTAEKKKVLGKASGKKLANQKTNNATEQVSKTTSQSVIKNAATEKLSFEAERLKVELTSRFSSCGELVSSDGTVIDKDYFMDCLHRKMKEPTMELLWSRIRGKSTFTPKTIKMLAFLQNRYKRLDKYEDVFNIEYFNTMEKVLDEFQNRKNYPTFVSADYKCNICYQKFISEKCLERHGRWHRESSGKFVCEVCQYRYPTEERLKHHFACYHQAVFKCKMCTYITYNTENMDGHYNRHLNLKTTCELCNKTLANKAMLKVHIRVKHSPTAPEQKICNQCGRAFCKQWFRRHLLKHHGVTTGVNPPVDGPGVTCDMCKVTFPTQEVHQTHMRCVHSEPGSKARKKRGPNRPRNTNHATTTTTGNTTSSTQAAEKKSREGRPLGVNGAWTCRVCSAVGKTWGKLAIHFEFEHPELDMHSVYADTTATLCEVCGKGLSNVYSLRDHMRMHTGDRPFACDMCPKRFSRSIGLTGHRLTHFPKNIPCPQCGKLFRQAGNLLNHARIHLNDRKYKCKVCGKGFLHRQALNEHFNGVHLHVRRAKRAAKKHVTETDRREDMGIYTGSSEYD